MVDEVTDGNFENLVIGSAATFFLLFTSPWCTTCSIFRWVTRSWSTAKPQGRWSRTTSCRASTSPWCSTCKKISPFLHTLSQRYPHIGFGRIDISTSPIVPSEHEVLSIPSLIVFRDGTELTRLTGHLAEEKLEQEAAKCSPS